MKNHFFLICFVNNLAPEENPKKSCVPIDRNCASFSINNLRNFRFLLVFVLACFFAHFGKYFYHKIWSSKSTNLSIEKLFSQRLQVRNFVFDVLCGLEVIASKLGHSFSEEVEMGANWKGEL